jgi:methionyl-tRNA formyltransferase
MATGTFAIPSVRALCESDFCDVVFLVATPLRSGTDGRPIITPARQIADEYGLLVCDPENINSPEFFEFLYLMRPDLIFVCDFGQILSKRTLSSALLGGINLHGSLLPKFRGAAPVHWAILTGDQYTGVSIIHMTPQIDAGPVIAQSPSIAISPYETVIELENRLAEYGAELVLDTVTRMAHNETVRIIPQLHDRVSKAPRFTKESGLIPWNRSSQEVFNHFRATVTWPRAFTHWHRENGSPLRLIVGEMTPLDDSLSELKRKDFSKAPFAAPILTDAKMGNLATLKAMPKVTAPKRRSSYSKRPPWWKPGIVIHAEEGILIVAAHEGSVRIEQIQPAGKKMMPVCDFLRGYPIKEGDKLG